MNNTEEHKEKFKNFLRNMEIIHQIFIVLSRHKDVTYIAPDVMLHPIVTPHQQYLILLLTEL